MALITSANYKTWAGISGSTYDAQLAVIVPQVIGAIERFCDVDSWDSATYTSQTYSGTGSEWLQLRNRPITAMTSVVYVDNSGGTQTLDSSTYRHDANTGRVFMLGSARGRFVVDEDDFLGVHAAPWGVSPSFVPGLNNYQVTYTAGYTTYPEELQLGAYMMVSDILAEVAAAVPVGGQFQSETLGSYSYTRMAKADLQGVMQMRFGQFRVGWL